MTDSEIMVSVVRLIESYNLGVDHSLAIMAHTLRVGLQSQGATGLELESDDSTGKTTKMIVMLAES